MPESMKQITFTKLDEGMGMPHLLDIQTRAFQSLLQKDAAAHNTEDVGLERVFKELFPISDVHENFSLEFVSYVLGEPKYSVEECIERDMTFSAPLKATLQLVINEDVNGLKRPRNIIQKEVYLGELPLLTDLGTFVINGAERVIVSQLHRSPGVVFEESTHPNGQRLISSRIIPEITRRRVSPVAMKWQKTTTFSPSRQADRTRLQVAAILGWVADDRWFFSGSALVS